MNLVRWNNQPRFSSLFDQLFNDPNYYTTFKSTSVSQPAANIQETDEGFELDLAIPGLNKDDVKINLEKNVLTISAESSTDNSNYSRREFGYNSFSRSFSLPKSINVEKIVAKHENGILSISLPKKEEEKVKLSREIKIS
ncbi:MAG: heat-shock protein [Bacteroidetes bacterium]|nr:heat-shock protein [Bacteroidota bacterium]|tara:strand:+ start:559 stop:978 length:420 start_codon:yes stop_codon:yes gene_type:complete